MGGGGNDSQTVSKAEPWEEQKPYLKDVYGKAKDLNENAPIIPWQGDLVAPVNDLQMGAIDMAAVNAGKINSAAGGYLDSSNDIINWAMQQAGSRGTAQPADLTGSLAPGGGFTSTAGRYSPSGFSSSVGEFTPTDYTGETAGDYTPRGYTAATYNQGSHTPFYLNPTENPSFMPGLEAALNPVYDRFLNEVAPKIGSAAEQQGAYGGSRHGVQMALATQLMNREVSDATAKAVSDAYFKERAMLAERENLEEQLATNRFLGLEDLATRRYTTEEGLLQAADEAEAELASDRWKTSEGLASDRWKTSANLETDRWMTQETLRQRDIEAAMGAETSRFVAGLDANTRAYLGRLQQDTALDTALMALGPEYAKLGMTGAQLGPSLLSSAGETLRGFDQQFLDESVTQYQNDMMAPYTNLKAYADLVMGNSGGGTTTSTTNGNTGFNPLSLLGPAIMGAGMLFGPSSRELKERVGPAPEVLSAIMAMPVDLWRYKGDANVHIGPYAEDFARETGLLAGRGVSISLIDAVGLLTKAVQELAAKVQKLEENRR